MPKANHAAEKLRIIVLGYIVRGPLAGHAWHHLHYVAGLERLGHDVWFIEDSDDFESCYDPEKDVMGSDPAYGLAFAQQAFDTIGVPDRWAYYDAHTNNWMGPACSNAAEICRSADILINLSGNKLRDWVRNIPVRVFMDTDPAFTQAIHLKDRDALELARLHTSFFTFAENVGRGALLSDDGLDWRPTRQPIVLDLWPVVDAPRVGSFTTVMLWDSYRTVEAGGLQLGMKSQSFSSYLDLPSLVEQKLEVAVGGTDSTREVLASHGWSVVDSRVPTRSLKTYRKYIEASRAEFTVAKHGYVAARTGWFSERSANYLATGRPVITQETGFSANLPTGSGLLAFSNPDEAAAAIREVAANYTSHSLAARRIAEEYFDSSVVLERLVQESVTQSSAGERG